MSHNTQHTRIFIAHAPEDEGALKMLLAELDELKEEQSLEYWHQGMMQGDSVRKNIIRRQLKQSQIILMLVSDDFIKTQYYAMLKKFFKIPPKDKIIIPVLIKKPDWENTDFHDTINKIKHRPKNDRNPDDIKLTPKDKKSKKTFYLKTIGLIGSLITVLALISGIYNDVPPMFKDFKKRVWKETTEHPKYKEEYFTKLPFLSSDSIFTVLILRFEDNISEDDDTYCIGRSIEEFLINIENKGTPVASIYADSILSPKRPQEAKLIQKRYNADLLLYGLANQIPDDCSEANVCFRHSVADTIMANIEVPKSIKKIKHDLEYQVISLVEIERGKFSVDEQSMEDLVNYWIALKNNDMETALAEIEKMTVNILGFSDEEKAEKYYQQGLSYYDLKEYNKSVLSLDKAVQLNPELANAYYLRGLIYTYLKEYDKIISNYNKAIQLKPKFATVYNNRGAFYFQLKNYGKAISDFDKAIQVKPKAPSAYYNRGLAYAHLKKYEEAISDFDIAIQLIKPEKDANTYCNRGLAYAHLKKYEKAVSDFDTTIQLKPKFTEAYNNRGGAHLYLNEYKKAINDFDKAIQLKPKNAKSYYNRGVVYSSLKEYESAITDFNQAIQLRPNHAATYFNRATSYSKSGNYKQAEKDYNKAIQINLKLQEHPSYKEFLRLKNNQ